MPTSKVNYLLTLYVAIELIALLLLLVTYLKIV